MDKYSGKLRKSRPTADKNPYGKRLVDDIVEELHGMLTSDPTGTERAIKNRDRRLKAEGKKYESPLKKLFR